MRRLCFFLLLLIPAVLAHHPVFEDSEFKDNLPAQYSNEFSLSESKISLEGEEYVEITITNLASAILFLIVDYPDTFLGGEHNIEIKDKYVLTINVDNSENSFGIIEFNSPERSLFLPVVNILPGDDRFGTNLDMDLDVFSGQNITFVVEMTDDNSEFTKEVLLHYVLVSKDNQKILESTETVQFDALIDKEFSFYIPEYISNGEYALFLDSSYGDIKEYDYSLFTLARGEVSNNGTFGLNYLFLIAIVGLFIFLIYNNRRYMFFLKKIHTKHSLSIKKHHASRAKAELVEKKLSSIRSAYLSGAISKKNYDIVVKKLREKIKQIRDSVKRGPK